MKTKEEILDKIIADEGLKFWEAHTDNFNRKIAMKAMDIFASQSLSSKIEEVREKFFSKERAQEFYSAMKNNDLNDIDIFNWFKDEFKEWERSEITSLEGGNKQ